MGGYWAGSYWAGSCWANPYWAGSGAADPPGATAPGTGAGCWPATFWRPGAWPGGFWPGTVGPDPALPEQLVDAVELAITAALVGRVAVPPDGLDSAGLAPFSWFGTGLADPGTPLPYASYAEPAEDDRPWDAAGTSHRRGQLQVQVFAAGKHVARALADRLGGLLAASAGNGALNFARGRLFRLRQASRTALQDPDPGPAGETVWVETRIFEFRYTTTQ